MPSFSFHFIILAFNPLFCKIQIVSDTFSLMAYGLQMSGIAASVFKKLFKPIWLPVLKDAKKRKTPDLLFSSIQA